MQTVFRFQISVPVADIDRKLLRYTQARVVINKIRVALSKAITDLGRPDLLFLVGKEASPDGNIIGIQNAAQIPKWHIDWLPTDNEASYQNGTLMLVLENDSFESALVANIIVAASVATGIDIKHLGTSKDELDYDIDGDSYSYTIENFYPRATRGWQRSKTEGDTNNTHYSDLLLPRDDTPHNTLILSRTIGNYVKSHMVANAEHHGLNVEALKSTPLYLKARWRFHFPKKELCNIKEQFFEASISVTFTSGVKLNGMWFAGGYRHVNSGLFRSATEKEIQFSKNGGAFVI